MAKRPKTARNATKKRKASAPRKRSADAGARKETTRLKRELAEALERQKATGEILAAISHSTSELQPILDTIVRTAAHLCDAEFSLIDRKSTRLNSSHLVISYAVFCLKNKKYAY